MKLSLMEVLDLGKRKDFNFKHGTNNRCKMENGNFMVIDNEHHNETEEVWVNAHLHSNWLNVEFEIPLNKGDLKTGDYVEFTDGGEGVVLLDFNVISTNGNGYIGIESLDENLVKRVRRPQDIKHCCFGSKGGEIIFETSLREVCKMDLKTKVVFKNEYCQEVNGIIVGKKEFKHNTLYGIESDNSFYYVSDDEIIEVL